MQFLKDLIEDKEIQDFWKEYRDFCEDLQTIDVDYFLEALPTLLEKIKNNYSPRQLNVALENLSKNDAKKGNELFSKILKIENLCTFPQLSDIIGGLYYSDIESAMAKIKKLVLCDNEFLRKIGLESIAKLDLSKENTPNEFLEWINTHLFDLANNGEQKGLWPSIFFVSRNHRQIFDNANEIIDILSTQRKVENQMELLSFLSYNLDLETEMDLVEKHLFNLLHIDLKYAGVYSQLSHFLETLLKMNLKVVLEFLGRWVDDNIENARKIGYFTYVLNELYDQYYSNFQMLYTNWLNNDKPNFHIAIFEMSRAGELRDTSNLTLSIEVLKDYSIYDIEYITYKILAYIYDRATSLSLVYSIFEQKFGDKEIDQFLSRLFVDYFIFNYYSTIDFLNEKKKNANPKLKKLIKEIVSEGERSYAAYSDLGFLKEFAPSERRLNQYNKIQSKKFRKSYKDTEKNSNSFLSMVKNLYFRTGKSSFAKFRGEYSQEMTPALISHSAEMPRGEFIDPIGQAKLRLLWQNFKRQK